MTTNKPQSPTNGEEKMREEWYKFLDTGFKTEGKIADWWLAQLKSSHLALLEQMIVEMPVVWDESDAHSDFGKGRVNGRNEVIHLINTNLRAKIEELKKIQ